MKFSQLKILAAEHGLQLVGVIAADQLQLALADDRARLEAWQARGASAGMHYMNRPPQLFADLGHFLPGVQTVLSFAIPYRTSTVREPTPPGFGRVAQYAFGADYHIVIRKKLERFVSALQNLSPGVTCRYFTDAVPLLERAISRISKLGFIGKNTMHIIPGVGSYTFLAELLLSAAIDLDGVAETRLSILQDKASCGSCTRCLTHCPTQAFSDAYQLDARRCISYLTIEHRGTHDTWQAAALGDWLFGCDICQEVCPFNHAAAEMVLEEFQLEKSNGPFLSLNEVLSISDVASFKHRFYRSPIQRAGYEGLLRNACAVAANTESADLLPLLIKLGKNCNGVLQTAAIQAITRLYYLAPRQLRSEIDVVFAKELQ